MHLCAFNPHHFSSVRQEIRRTLMPSTSHHAASLDSRSLAVRGCAELHGVPSGMRVLYCRAPGWPKEGPRFRIHQVHESVRSLLYESVPGISSNRYTPYIHQCRLVPSSLFTFMQQRQQRSGIHSLGKSRHSLETSSKTFVMFLRCPQLSSREYNEMMRPRLLATAGACFRFLRRHKQARDIGDKRVKQHIRNCSAVPFPDLIIDEAARRRLRRP